jgi:hypothetical protein
LTADDILKLVHFTYFHSITCCEFIIKQNSAGSNGIFTIPKKITTAMAGFKERVHCTEIPHQSQTLPPVSVFLLSLLPSMLHKMDMFQTHNQTKYRA